jgi:type I restriction enzyme S subunit
MYNESFVTNNSFIVLPNTDFCYFGFSYIYGQMVELNFHSIRTGSAQPQLTNNSISMLDVIIPDKDIIVLFSNIAKNYYAKIDSLYKQLQLLQQARDKLLPRLMSGEMEV